MLKQIDNVNQHELPTTNYGPRYMSAQDQRLRYMISNGNPPWADKSSLPHGLIWLWLTRPSLWQSTFAKSHIRPSSYPHTSGYLNKFPLGSRKDPTLFHSLLDILFNALHTTLHSRIWWRFIFHCLQAIIKHQVRHSSLPPQTSKRILYFLACGSHGAMHDL